MKIWKISSDQYYSYSAWILSNGDVKEVPFEEHAAFVTNNLSLFNTSKEEMKEIYKTCKDSYELFEQKYKLAFRSGAIRIYFGNFTIFVSGKKQDIVRHAEIIHRIFKKLSAEMIEYVPINDSDLKEDFSKKRIIRDPGELYSISMGNRGKIYKMAKILNIKDLMQEALKFDSAEDFSRAYSVKQNLIENGININQDGTVTLYHATLPKIAEKIKSEGYIRGGSTATGGMTGLALEPSAFFGWNRDWVKDAWGRSRDVIEINVPYWYIRQPAKNDQEIYFEGGLKRVDDSRNIWEPIKTPRDTFYSILPSLDYNFENEEETLEKIWEKARENI